MNCAKCLMHYAASRGIMNSYPKPLQAFILWSSRCSCSFTRRQYFKFPNTP